MPSPYQSVDRGKWERSTRYRRNRVRRWSARPVVRSRANPPSLIDHLLTFESLQIRYGPHFPRFLTQILGTLSGPFLADLAVEVRQRPRLGRVLPCGKSRSCPL